MIKSEIIEGVDEKVKDLTHRDHLQQGKRVRIAGLWNRMVSVGRIEGRVLSFTFRRENNHVPEVCKSAKHPGWRLSNCVYTLDWILDLGQ